MEKVSCRVTKVKTHNLSIYFGFFLACLSLLFCLTVKNVEKKKTHNWFCTWEEHVDFGCFIILSPAVCVFTVERVTGVLACVSTGAVDHPQDAISLLLDCPAQPKEESIFEPIFKAVQTNQHFQHLLSLLEKFNDN